MSVAISVFINRVVFIVGIALSIASYPVVAKSESQSLTIVVSIKPIKLLMEAFLGESAIVHQLVPDGITPHDFQLKLSDLQKLEKAQLVLWLGAAAEPYLVKTLEQKHSAQLNMMKIPGLIRYPYRDLRDWDGHDEDGHQDQHNHTHEHTDIHFWLSQANNRLIVDAVVKIILQQKLIPAEVLHNRRKKMEAELKAVEQLTSDRKIHSNVLVYHDAFQYLEHELQLDNRGAVVADLEASVGLRRLLRLKALVKKENIQCVLVTPGSNRRILAKIFSQQTHRTAEIDILAAGPNIKSYRQYWVGMVDNVKECIDLD